MPIIVITGVSSFVGRELALHFKSLGHEVFGTTSKNQNAYTGIQKIRLGNLIKNKISLHQLDLEKPSQIKSTIHKLKPDYWINHAAWTAQASSMDFNIEKAATSSVFALDTIFSTLKEIQCKGIIITGSNAEYPNQEGELNENIWGPPPSPYGLSKLATTMQANILSQYYSLPCFVMRLFNPIGKFDNPKKLIPSVITHFNQQKPIDLSACNQQRDFTAVSNVTSAYEAAISNIEAIGSFEIFNVCEGKPTILKELLLRFCEDNIALKELLNFNALNQRMNEPHINYGNNDKAVNLLNWYPVDKINFKELLKHYV